MELHSSRLRVGALRVGLCAEPLAASLLGMSDNDDEEPLIRRYTETPRRRQTRQYVLLTVGAVGLTVGYPILRLHWRHRPTVEQRILVHNAAKVAPSPARRRVVEEENADAAIEREFWASRVVKRQMVAWTRECACTRELMKQQEAAHASLSRIVVLDGSGFRWEGLGNSGVRWMGLLRWGYATSRATFLRLSRDEDCKKADKPEKHIPSQGRPSDRTCHLDPGTYFVGHGGVDWQWSGARAAGVEKEMRERGESELVLTYECAKASMPGCSVARLKFANGESNAAAV